MIESTRLLLRPWQASDAAPYFAMNQDPQVIEFLRGPLTMEEVTHFMEAMNRQLTALGYTLWAIARKSDGAFIGFVGLSQVPFEAPFTPAVEIGWRLASAYWGQGYASEAAEAALSYGFKVAQLPEVVAFTVPANVRSQRVMEKIGMVRDMQGDFLHPRLAADHPLSKHVLYRIRNDN